MSTTANCMDPDLPSHNVLADIDLCILLGVISRANNIDLVMHVHYAKADQDRCCFQFDATYKREHMVVYIIFNP